MIILKVIEAALIFGIIYEINYAVKLKHRNDLRGKLQ